MNDGGCVDVEASVAARPATYLSPYQTLIFLLDDILLPRGTQLRTCWFL